MLEVSIKLNPETNEVTVSVPNVPNYVIYGMLDCARELIITSRAMGVTVQREEKTEIFPILKGSNNVS